jgi:transposase-like protein
VSVHSSLYYRYRFPPEIISYAVYLYYRFTASYRYVEEMLARRGIVVSYQTIRRWCLKFGPHSASWNRSGRSVSTSVPAATSSQHPRIVCNPGGALLALE